MPLNGKSAREAIRPLTLFAAPHGPVQVKAGTIVSDDLQDELDDRCK